MDSRMDSTPTPGVSEMKQTFLTWSFCNPSTATLLLQSPLEDNSRSPSYITVIWNTFGVPRDPVVPSQKVMGDYYVGFSVRSGSLDVS